MAKVLNSPQEYEEVVKGDKPVVDPLFRIVVTALQDFWAQYNLMATDDLTKSALCLVDVDNQNMQSICSQHGVSCMPTLVYIKGGSQVDKMEGVNKPKLEGWVQATA
eukprot:CAMPEP_0170261850 /NCGR_PEP_ID=MMETSP0116_2-20130129/30807_1 /TAXON_ID=400756 /ORGANISM="Durinskia baltica, Strain CSIRO CS-38" /LENGTH=106 /DNA_ID=CAMNT_0010512917 /DNA_START=73 /DNA_END=393 /DNA_ORIENTATION=+